eukprot:COSAG01_NODE_516_length_16026_cov_63.502857_3_plen_84_part_00
MAAARMTSAVRPAAHTPSPRSWLHLFCPPTGNISPTRGITRNGGAVFDVGRAQGAGAWIALVERGGGATFVQKAQRVSEAGAN